MRFCRHAANSLAYMCIAVQGSLGQVRFQGALALKKLPAGRPTSSLRDWGARFCQGVENCHESRINSKNHDKLINFIVRVSLSVF